ncbi:MAG: Smr/MutS family protein [Treponema sp.]|jgi:DNA-nicking Smr family endonuclease|nr:Smr/MutS family protein [Treponema sp.]
MDFGDILEQWDKQAASQAKKTPPKETGENPSPQDTVEEKKVNPQDAWMRINGVFDKDAGSGMESVIMEGRDHSGEFSPRDAAQRRRRLLAKKPDAVLDLHGLTRDDAWDALEIFFNDGKRQGFDKLLVIHGKGNHTSGEAILARAVRDYIERCPFAGESGHGDAASGGSGATWVLLKDYRSR